MFGLEKLPESDIYAPIFRVFAYLMVFLLCFSVMSFVFKVFVYITLLGRISKLEGMIKILTEDLKLTKELVKIGVDNVSKTKKVLEEERSIHTKIDTVKSSVEDVKTSVDELPVKVAGELTKPIPGQPDSGIMKMVIIPQPM